jgi:RND family efflux transporter MFP subunit
MPDEGISRIARGDETSHASALGGRGPEAPPPDVHADMQGHHHAPRPSTGRLKFIGLVVAIAAISIAIYGIILRRVAEHHLAVWTDQQALPSVSVSHPITSAAVRALTLPGDVEAYYEAPLYARVNGYLHMWFADIGAHVKAGQTLATIDTPDLDQQLAQAEADLATAKANSALADLTAGRWHALLATTSVSQQSADEKAGAATAARAGVSAQQAHVDQLRALETFKRIMAPFDGVVTVRNTDIGALINAGSSAAEPLFKVADVHEMRVYVRVPQVYASELATGLHATLTQPQYPGVTFPATLATTSQSVAAASRTVLVELMADNKDAKLWPGTYAQVKFDLPPDSGVLRVPSSALIFRSAGAQVATLGPHNRIVMKDVVVARNLGSEIEIQSGLSPNDQVVDTPLDTLEDGEQVQIGGGDAPPPAAAD